MSAPEASSNDASGNKPTELLNCQVRNTGSDSPASAVPVEHQLLDKKESSSPQNLDNFADIGLVRENSPSYAPSESQSHQDPPEIPGFSVSPVCEFCDASKFYLLDFDFGHGGYNCFLLDLSCFVNW